MPVLLVTYDLNKPGQDYDDFLKTIKSYACARLSESSYAIDTTEPPSAVYNKLRPDMDENDYLCVMTLVPPYAGHNRKDVIDWLEKHLPQ